MTSSSLLLDNQTIQNNLDLSNTTNSQSAYWLSSPRFIAYNVARCCQVSVGVPENLLTLLIIKRMPFRLNMHIIMVYMAVSDILSSATLPMAIYMGASAAQLITFTDHWDKICIIKTYFDLIFMVGCILSYTLLSVDR